MELLPNPTNEYELIQSWKNGDEQAFDQLFKLHFYPLNRFAYRHTNDAELAEELVMDIMLKLWQKRDYLENDNISLSPFLFHLLKAAIIDNYRKKRLEIIDIEIVTKEPEHPIKTDDRLLSRELLALYQQALSCLSPQKRRVLEMRLELGMSYKEIAGELNISPKTVDRHLNGSMSFIRSHLSKHTDVILLVICIFFR